MNCVDEEAENAAVQMARAALKRFLVKSKTVSGGGIELAAEILTSPKEKIGNRRIWERGQTAATPWAAETARITAEW